jgi:hypothetical protein
MNVDGVTSETKLQEWELTITCVGDESEDGAI